jgi:hypothetical protein
VRTKTIHKAKVSASDILAGQMCGFINSDNKDNKGKVSAMKGMETEQRDDPWQRGIASKSHKQ